MDWLQQLNVEKFLLFTLVLTRVSGLTMTAPIYGTKDVPAQVRVFLAVALAMLIAPSQWEVDVIYPETTLNYMIFIGSELLVGLCLGLGITILFSGVHLAGLMIGRVSGMMLADVFDPSLEANVPTLSRILFMVALAVFVCLGGHRIVMGGLLDTFQTIPPGSLLPWHVPGFQASSPGDFEGTIPGTFVLLLTQSFYLGIRAAVPVVTALLLSTLVMGLISRTLPQLNILMVGFGMNSMLTFAIFWMTIGAAAMLFQPQVSAAMETLLEALHVQTYAT